MTICLISPKGQVMIPKILREKFGLKINSKVSVTEINGQIVIVPLLDNPLHDMHGILKDGEPLCKIYKEYKEEEKKRESQREERLL